MKLAAAIVTTILTATIASAIPVADEAANVVESDTFFTVDKRSADPEPNPLWGGPRRWWVFCHLPGQGCRKSKRAEAGADSNANTEAIQFADFDDLVALSRRSANPEASPLWGGPRRWWVFCHLPGQGCKKVKRDAELADDIIGEPVEYITKDDLVEGDATHDMIKRSADASPAPDPRYFWGGPRRWWVFCHLPGQGCKKVRREVESLHDTPVDE